MTVGDNNTVGLIGSDENHATHELVVLTRGRIDIVMVTVYWHTITCRVYDEGAKQVLYKLSQVRRSP